MCGFTGIFSKRKLAEGILNSLKDSQNKTLYRGPDEQSLIAFNNFALSFNRLSINNLSEGKQPLLL